MSLYEAFSSLQDPRRAQGRRITLPSLLSICVLGYLCGYRGYRGIARFGNAHSELLCEKFGLSHGIPSYVTFREVLQKFPDTALISAFTGWIEGFSLPQGSWLAGDGKVLGSTVSSSQSSAQNFTSVVTLFAQESGIAHRISTYQNKEKGQGEQACLRHLLQELKGMGAIITADALHAQKKR